VEQTDDRQTDKNHSAACWDGRIKYYQAFAGNAELSHIIKSMEFPIVFSVRPSNIHMHLYVVYSLRSDVLPCRFWCTKMSAPQIQLTDFGRLINFYINIILLLSQGCTTCQRKLLKLCDKFEEKKLTNLFYSFLMFKVRFFHAHLMADQIDLRSTSVLDLRSSQ